MEVFTPLEERDPELAQMLAGYCQQISEGAIPRDSWARAVRDLKNTGRNDPCFCGSELKYKKCHGRNS